MYVLKLCARVCTHGVYTTYVVNVPVLFSIVFYFIFIFQEHSSQNYFFFLYQYKGAVFFTRFIS